MLIGSCQMVGGKALCLLLNDSVLKQVSFSKYLGVYTDVHDSNMSKTNNN